MKCLIRNGWPDNRWGTLLFCEVILANKQTNKNSIIIYHLGMFKKLMVLGTGDPCLLKSHTKRETINYHEFLMDNHLTINEVVSLREKKNWPRLWWSRCIQRLTYGKAKNRGTRGMIPRRFRESPARGNTPRQMTWFFPTNKIHRKVKGDKGGEYRFKIDWKDVLKRTKPDHSV